MSGRRLALFSVHWCTLNKTSLLSQNRLPAGWQLQITVLLDLVTQAHLGTVSEWQEKHMHKCVPGHRNAHGAFSWPLLNTNTTPLHFFYHPKEQSSRQLGEAACCCPLGSLREATLHPCHRAGWQSGRKLCTGPRKAVPSSQALRGARTLPVSWTVQCGEGGTLVSALLWHSEFKMPWAAAKLNGNK